MAQESAAEDLCSVMQASPFPAQQTAIYCSSCVGRDEVAHPCGPRQHPPTDLLVGKGRPILLAMVFVFVGRCSCEKDGRRVTDAITKDLPCRRALASLNFDRDTIA